MPERKTSETMAMQSCPSCGSLNEPDAMRCVQCGMDLGLEDDRIDFEEFEEGLEDEIPEVSGFEEVKEARERDDRPLAGPPTPRAEDLAGRDEERRPISRTEPGRGRRPGEDPRGGRGPDPRSTRGGPRPTRGGPGKAGSGRGGPGPARARPEGPSKPGKPKEEIEPVEKRESIMGRFTIYLVVVGLFNYGLTYGMGMIFGGLKMGTMSWLGHVVLQLVVAGIIGAFGVSTGRLQAKSRDKTTRIESKNLGRILKGVGVLLFIFLIQVFGMHRAIPGIPDPGNYNSEWSIVYIPFTLAGIYLIIKGLYNIREKMSYYKIWRYGIWLLLLAPLTGALDSLSPLMLDYGRILNHQSYFAYSISTLFVLMTVVSFGLKGHLTELYTDLERETKRGEELFKSERYREAMRHLDNAIDIGHDLYSQYFYDPDSPRATQHTKLPAQYGIPWLRKGDVYVQLGRPRKAIAIYDVILELDSRNEVVWNRKGEVLMALNNLKEARRCFDKALSAVPNYVKAVQNRQKVMEMQRREAEKDAGPRLRERKERGRDREADRNRWRGRERSEEGDRRPGRVPPPPGHGGGGREIWNR